MKYIVEVNGCNQREVEASSALEAAELGLPHCDGAPMPGASYEGWTRFEVIVCAAADVSRACGGDESVLPDDWRERRGLAPEHPRFHVVRGDTLVRSGWSLVDDAYAAALSFDTRGAADDAACLARAYVKEHGDIDLNAFPSDPAQPLAYDDEDTAQDWWTHDHPSKGSGETT
jgi:hypothetical protein